ncbi:hypothetical protein [Sulfuricurvum sp.]|uniref:hypothetical protein n=1 Tax=Sulfuricurvum sp. TaxID=2025608 RepID=UPI0026115062|nr:hypothetical protein [Sulfuricurvum sp.]MDD4950693.1 hypothetical protein [Sulfuricurvum sp.]
MSLFENLNKKGINVNKALTLAASVAVALVVTGCGGGSSSSAAPATTLTGTFVDSPVVGLDYNCTSTNGITDENGSFSYKANDTCQFGLGSITLGSVKMVDANVTPSDLADGNSTVIGNIASLLQSLDDHNMTGKIHITSAMKNRLSSGMNVRSDATTFYDMLDGNKSVLGISTVIDTAKAVVNMNNYLALGLSNTVITGKVLNGTDASRITFYDNGVYYAEYLDTNGTPNGVTGAGTWVSKDGKTVYFTNNISHKTTIAQLTSSTSATITAPDNTVYTVTFTQAPIVQATWNGTASGLYSKTLSIASPGIDPARIHFNSNGTLVVAFLSGVAGSGTWSVGLDHSITINIAGKTIVITLNTDGTGTITTNGQTYPAVYILQ